MRNPNDPRNVCPRAGSPLWLHLAVVTAAGAGVLVLSAPRLAAGAFPGLLTRPVLWIVVALALLGEVRPIVTPGKSVTDSGKASHTFCFAALLFWGFGVAVLIRLVITIADALVQRTAPFRTAFNVAQYVLGLATAALVLSALGAHPRATHPWVPQGGQWLAVGAAAVAYFAVNFVLVGVAVALHTRAGVVATLRKDFPYQVFVNVVLLSAAPLVVVVMDRSAPLVLLFLLPLVAIHANATMSLQREHQAHHDDLTGLPNRTFLLRQTAESLARAGRSGERVGFLLLDLDRFKEVNDTLGHPVGDSLLKVVAARLAHSVRPGDVVARIGGDEFAVLLPSVREGSCAREVATRLRGSIAEPVCLEGMSFEVEASVGIALYPGDAADVDLLMQRADVAMYLAKERGTGVECYASEADRNSAARMSMVDELARGIGEGELELHFQPKVSLADGRTEGMEALVRWRHPTRGLMLPRDFIPVAEQSYLMRDLTAWVVHTALAWTAQWQRSGLRVPVSVNLTARDLLDAGLVEMVQAALREHGLRTADLIVEVSEQVLAGGSAHATATLGALAACGVRVSLDDFGTGDTPLVTLQRLPISEVKIDASLITRLLGSEADHRLVGSLMELVRALGIRSVAEGVEDEATAAALGAIGCDSAQGWHFGAPFAPSAATGGLADRYPLPRTALLPLGMPPKARQPTPAPEPTRPPPPSLTPTRAV